MPNDDCLLCRVASGATGLPLLYDDDLVVAFDIPEGQTEHGRPVRQAPVHFLVIPREHVSSANAAEERHEPALGRLFTAAAKVAREMGVSESGYRLVSNTGEDAGQTEFHLHLHCLGGRKLGDKG